jgi:hypothetical protein
MFADSAVCWGLVQCLEPRKYLINVPDFFFDSNGV